MHTVWIEHWATAKHKTFSMLLTCEWCGGISVYYRIAQSLFIHDVHHFLNQFKFVVLHKFVWQKSLWEENSTGPASDSFLFSACQCIRVCVYRNTGATGNVALTKCWSLSIWIDVDVEPNVQRWIRFCCSVWLTGSDEIGIRCICMVAWFRYRMDGLYVSVCVFVCGVVGQ